MVDTNDEWITSRTGIKKKILKDKDKALPILLSSSKDLLRKSNTDPLKLIWLSCSSNTRYARCCHRIYVATQIAL